jgi:hypothetical protein
VNLKSDKVNPALLNLTQTGNQIGETTFSFPTALNTFCE